VSPIGMRDNEEMARALDAFARVGNGGLIVTASPLATLNRELIVAIAICRCKHRPNTSSSST
jgi:hypothetical protein